MRSQLDELLALRPAENTAVAMRTAIEKISTKMREYETAAKTLVEQRNSMLLVLPAKRLTEMQNEAAELEIAAEQARELLAPLIEVERRCVRDEDHGELERKVLALQSQQSAFAYRFAADYEKILEVYSSLIRAHGLLRSQAISLNRSIKSFNGKYKTPTLSVRYFENGNVEYIDGEAPNEFDRAFRFIPPVRQYAIPEVYIERVSLPKLLREGDDPSEIAMAHNGNEVAWRDEVTAAHWTSQGFIAGLARLHGGDGSEQKTAAGGNGNARPGRGQASQAQNRAVDARWDDAMKAATPSNIPFGRQP
jgi:hypothetical protein